MAKRKGPQDDPTVRKVLEKAFASMPFHQQVLAVAEASVDATVALPTSVGMRGKEMLEAVTEDTAKAYRGGKLKAMAKHAKETEISIAVSIRLLMHKHDLTMDEAADVLGLRGKDVRRVMGKKEIKAMLKSPARLLEEVHPGKRKGAKKKPAKKKKAPARKGKKPGHPKRGKLKGPQGQAEQPASPVAAAS